MKKNNQRGFVLAESFIVSTFVLGILVFMFLQIRTIINGFDKSFTYNTVPSIYVSRELTKFIKKNEYGALVEKVDNNSYVILDSSDSQYENIFNMSNVKTVVVSIGNLNNLKNDTTLSQKFQNYIDTLSNSSGYQFIVEFNDDTFAAVKGDNI